MIETLKIAQTILEYLLDPPLNELGLRSFLRDRLSMPQMPGALQFSRLVAAFAVLALVLLESSYRCKEQ